MSNNNPKFDINFDYILLNLNPKFDIFEKILANKNPI